MSKLTDVKNVFIEYQILLDSDKEAIKKEIDILISAGKLIFLWSKTVPVEEMILWCIEHDLYDYIWDYKVKDSTNYAMVDMIIDNDKRVINRFSRRNIPANYIEKII